MRNLAHDSVPPLAASYQRLLLHSTLGLLLCAAGCSEQALEWLWTHEAHHGCSGAACDAGTPCPYGNRCDGPNCECQPACPAGAVRADQDCEWTYTGLAASSNHTCGVRAETGEVVCWGQSTGASGWPRNQAFAQVATGAFLSCGVLRDSGALRCWGLWIPVDLPSADAFTQVAVGVGQSFDVCAIRRDDATVQCWTASAAGPALAAPSGVAFSKINMADGYACGIRRDDSRLQCWGDFTAPEAELCALSKGASYIVGMCGLRCDGQAMCFGSSLSELASPPSTERFTELEVGMYVVCGIRAADGSIACWSIADAPAEPPRGNGFEQLVVGGDTASINSSIEYGSFMHACVLRTQDQRVLCWGDDSAGQVSGAPNFTRFSQLAVDTDQGFGHISSVDTVCALRERDQLAQCWGGTSGLPLDQPLRKLATTSCGILAADGGSSCGAGAPAGALSEVDAHAAVSCGIRADDHRVSCWSSGTPADARISDAPQAIAVHGLTVGNRHACAIRDSDDQAMCWGNDKGGPITDTLVGVQIRQLQTEKLTDPLYDYIADAQTCGVREPDGLVQCWGTRDALIVAARPTEPLWKLSQSGACGLSLDAHEAVCASDTPPLPGVRLREFETGANTQCAIRETDNLLTCWGGMLWNPL